MNKSKLKNGNVDIDTDQMAAMRQQVVEQELSARSWKAYYEKMYYSLESEKLEPAYKEYQERMRVRMEEEKKKMNEFIKTLQENAPEGVNVEEQEGKVIQMTTADES